MKLRFSSCAALALLTFVAASADANVDGARAKGLSWLVKAQNGDGSFAGLQGLEVQSTSAAVQAMLLGGMGRAPQNARAIAWLSNAPQGSMDARSAQVAALAAAGRDATAIAGRIRDDRNYSAFQAGAWRGGVATWGAYAGYGASVVDTALGYGALRLAAVTYLDDGSDRTVTALCNVIPAQLNASPWSGAWPHSLPQTGQPTHATNGSLFATSVMLLELKRQRLAGGFFSASVCGRASPSAIDTAMLNAKNWLSAQANADGGFAERSPQTGLLEASNLVATALAIQALAPFAAEGEAIATTRITSARNWLLAQQSADGSWGGDPFVTAKVLTVLPAANGAQIADADNDGLPDVVEQQLGTRVAVADAQGALATNASAKQGSTASAFSATGSVGRAFSYDLKVAGEAVSTTYSKVSGTLPGGLSLSPRGVISGMPSQPGSFAFDYEVNRGAAGKTLVIGRIDIAASRVPGADDETDVPLPAWALALLGGALLTVLRRKASN